ncbi:STAS domain-containing protein [Saccharothrix algeriensis]|uniref:Anti-sigma factor antagonist n=1 Tax=Saccharothrix algeriensis TaxID=173560 RepID=A0A8T8HUT6_9PSEU|nr:STAS domain-containing protein [Saccharothrix algeriensis]MBM7813893.1 anti-anti-sigma factor [Saccharothrix algeriensis]QTR02325.1 STAS domain-containing protein [Saccharothrix algeriensis]
MTVQDPNVLATSGAGSAAESARTGQVVRSVDRPADGVVVVAAGGEIDMLTAPELRADVLGRLDDGDTLVLDLSGVSFLGSAGLAVLVEAAQHAKRRGTAFRVVAVARAVTRPLVATGLGEVFSVYGSVAEALAADGAA